MKIQCDVCNKDEASVFCTADEAALCEGCDHRVHHANKLASKHHRFSLLSPSSKEFPICDVCQEKRAFLFCQQDRAILCRECDGPIHTANEHTRKHNRFLLTGVKLSASSAVYTSTAPSASFDTVPDFRLETSVKKPVPASAAASTQHPKTTAAATAASATVIGNGKDLNNNSLVHHGNGSTSSISEYLIEMLPGWHFEDFLDSCSASFGFCKNNEGSLPFLETDELSSFSSESLGIWVPQAPSPAYRSTFQNLGQINGFKEPREPLNVKHTNKRWSDDVFAVPQISPPSTGFKRSRHFY